jgi:hypothetical protein
MAVRVSKAEWIAQRLAGEQARGLFDNIPKMTGPKPPNPFGREGSLSRDLSKQITQESRRHMPGEQAKSLDQIKKAAKAGKTLWADRDSDCFASVSWTDGTCTLEFYRGGSVVYDVEMSLSEYLEFAHAPEGLGEFFNANIR